MSLQASKSLGNLPIPLLRHTGQSIPVSSGQFTSTSAHLLYCHRVLWFRSTESCANAPTPPTSNLSRRSLTKGNVYGWWKMHKIYNSDIFNRRPHDLFSSFFWFPNNNSCLLVGLQKLLLELSVLIKYQLLWNCYIDSLTPVFDELHKNHRHFKGLKRRWQLKRIFKEQNTPKTPPPQLLLSNGKKWTDIHWPRAWAFAATSQNTVNIFRFAEACQ